jgi:dihydroorotase
VAEWTVDPDAFFSKGRNTPFAGWRLRGRVLATMLAGRFTHVTGGVEFANAPQPTGASR